MIVSKPRIMKIKSKNYERGELGYGDGDIVELCCDKCGKHYTLKFHDRMRNYLNRAERDLCRGCRQSEDYAAGIRTHTFTEYNKAQAGKTLTERFGNEDWRKTHKGFKTGLDNPHNFNLDANENGRGYVGYYQGHLFRSLFELSFIYEMLKAGHKIESAEKITIIYKVDNEEHQYRPDFLVDNKIIYEVKDQRDLTLEIVQLKKEAAENYCKQHNLSYKLVGNKEFRNLTRSQIIKLYNNNDISFIDKSLERFKKYWLKEQDNV